RRPRLHVPAHAVAGFIPLRGGAALEPPILVRVAVLRRWLHRPGRHGLVAAAGAVAAAFQGAADVLAQVIELGRGLAPVLLEVGGGIAHGLFHVATGLL